MKRTSLVSLVWLASLLGMSADLEPQPKPTLTKGPSSTWDFDWTGMADRTYFSQWSLELMHWSYFPGIKYGDGPQFSNFASSSPRFFVRLHFVDIPTEDPELADFDNDGMSNLDEVMLGTDPLDPDSDHDGILDCVEVANGGNPLSNADGDALRAVDSDGDGLSDAVELARGTSPTLWDSDGDGANDAVDAYPLDPSRSAIETSIGTDTTKPVVLLESPANAVLVSGP